MYAVVVDIYTDGDFGFEDSEFNLKAENEVERMIVFQNRSDAVEALKKSIRNIKQSFYSSGNECINIKLWFDELYKVIHIITEKIENFSIYKDFGNQSTSFGLYEVEKNILENGGFYYTTNEDPFLEFSIDELNYETLCQI